MEAASIANRAGLHYKSPNTFRKDSESFHSHLACLSPKTQEIYQDVEMSIHHDNSDVVTAPDDVESAIVQLLAPGSYTAIVRGVNNTAAVAARGSVRVELAKFFPRR
jgi:hypothetical protein